MIRARDDGLWPEAVPLTEQDAIAHLHGICFKTGPPERVGVELEWLVCDARHPALPVGPARVRAALAGLDRPGALPAEGRLTTEPGGQLELSSLPAASIGDCLANAANDMAALTEAMQAAGLRLSGHGLDPFRPPLRVLDSPRYAAMEEFFDRSGPAGRIMMCSTASVQVCLDAGEDGAGQQSYRRRWHLLHAIGPVLVAAFANSPLRQGRPTGWRSTRQAVWAKLDPGRTRPPQGSRTRPPQGTGRPEVSTDLRSQWAAYALDAELMCIRRHGTDSWAAPPGLTFRDWLLGAGVNARLPGGASGVSSAGAASSEVSSAGSASNGAGASGASGGASNCQGASDGHDAKTACDAGGTHRAGGPHRARQAARACHDAERRPTLDDLDYHVSTLFPPVRPRGHLELRMIDAQPGDGWVVPTAVVWALLNDALAGDAALAAAEPLWDGHRDPWSRAARHGPADECIAGAIRACFDAAYAALRRSGAPAPLLRSVADFAARYVQRDRCPADDLLEECA